MAKRATSGRAGTSNLNAAAERVGAALGHFAVRIAAWKQQRDAIAGDLRKYVATAQTMLEGLGHKAQAQGSQAFAAAAQAMNEVRSSSGKPGRRKGYTQSEEARRKMRLAWKKRKAAQKLAGKGVGKKATRVAKPVTKAATEKV